MKLILIRHGDPDYLHDDLTRAGVAEAKALNKRVRKWAEHGPFNAYVSPLGRAQRTAELALKHTGITPATLPWLEEFRGRLPDGEICWDLPPQLYADTWELHDAHAWQDAALYQNTNVKAIHQETAQGLDDLLEDYGYVRDGNLYRPRPDAEHDAVAVLFCHLALSLDCLSHLLNIAAPLLWQQTFLAPASVTILGTEEYVPGCAQFRMQTMGDTSHLAMAGVPVSSSGYFGKVFPG